MQFAICIFYTVAQKWQYVAQKFQNVEQNVEQKFVCDPNFLYLCGKIQIHMATVKQTLSEKTDKNGLSQVMFYVVLGRTARFRVKSGIFVYRKYWNDKKQAMSVPKRIGQTESNELVSINEQLQTAIERTYKLLSMYGENADKTLIESVLTDLKDYDGKLTDEVVTKYLIGKQTETEKLSREKKVKNALQLCEKFFTDKQLVTRREDYYKVLFRSMHRFEIYRNYVVKRPFVWDIDTVSRKDIEELFDFFAKEKDIRERYEKTFAKHKLMYSSDKQTHNKNAQRSENRLASMKKGVKAFWHWLLKSDFTTNDPVSYVNVGTELYGDPFYLTTEERDIIANHDFSYNKHLEKIRDIFVFQCYVACRVGDFMNLTPNNIVNDMLVYTPHKTKKNSNNKTAEIPLTDDALRLIEKYKDIDSKGRLFPFISAQKYNAAIKDVLRCCGINRMVSWLNPQTREYEMKPICELATSHTARKTFAGNAYLLVQDPNLICSMTGHVEGSKAFARYRKIEDTTKRNLINKMFTQK